MSSQPSTCVLVAGLISPKPFSSNVAHSLSNPFSSDGGGVATGGGFAVDGAAVELSLLPVMGESVPVLFSKIKISVDGKSPPPPPLFAVLDVDSVGGVGVVVS